MPPFPSVFEKEFILLFLPYLWLASFRGARYLRREWRLEGKKHQVRKNSKPESPPCGRWRTCSPGDNDRSRYTVHLEKSHAAES